jgi:unsaturated rhamnogalacturonyl hydrolase
VANFFYDPQNPEARYLWRWTCFNAPDLLLEVRTGDTVRWEISDATSRLASVLKASRMAQDDSLLAALSVGNPSGLAPIPSLRLTSPHGSIGAELGRLWSAIAQPRALGPSPARRALDSRRSRSTVEVARVLASTYGHKLDPVIYTQGVAISGRLRLARLDSRGPAPVQDVIRLVEPYTSGEKPMFGDQASGQHFAGIVWAEELLELTGDRRYADALVSAANRYQPSEEGKAPPPSDPDFRTEDMFFNAAILGRAFKLTGEGRYLEMLVRFLLDARVQQGDGLFWHCRSAPYYWGRGNGFAALGYAEALTYMPPGHPERDALLAMHIRHLNALRQVQNPSGMWLQVLNFPGSYQEMSVTCMVGYALARGLRLGWLDSSFRPSLELAWQGVSERIDDAGGLVDVCTGTGVQKSLRDYLDRPAVFGLDDRGGSLALWFAAEMEQFLRRA